MTSQATLIGDLLARGVEHIYPKPEFLDARLKEDKSLTLYTGYDPTADTLHIGHGISLLKLRQFQELGHKVIMLIGDFTGMIGDPTDKSAARKKLTREEVLKNCVKYKEQAAAILDFGGSNPAEIKFNSDWLGKMNFADVLELAAHFTVQQMLERDMFEKRIKDVWVLICPNPECKTEHEYQNEKIDGKDCLSSDTLNKIGKEKCSSCQKDLWPDNSLPEIKFYQHRPSKPIYLHEFLYPLMQGYDSVAMDVDGEVGGNDQTFNMLAGRTLMKEIKGKEKFVLTVKLLADDSGKKMGKSEGNMIALSDSPEDMFGKVMRWSDGMIKPAFELCTRVPMAEIEEIMAAKNPRDAKLRLAFEITKQFLGTAAADEGKARFIEVIQKKEVPEEIPALSPSASDIITVLVEAKFAKSKSDARQLIAQGGVKINDSKVSAIEVAVKSGDVVQKGNRFFVRVI